MHWKDVDFDRGTVTVRRALIWRETGGGWYFGEPKITKSRRSIPLPATNLRALAEHRRRQAEERLKPGRATSNMISSSPRRKAGR